MPLVEGSGQDNTAAIQALIDAKNTGSEVIGGKQKCGGIAAITNGAYRTTAQLTTYNAVRVLGDGEGASMIYCSGSFPLLFMDTPDVGHNSIIGATIENLRFLNEGIGAAIKATKSLDTCRVENVQAGSAGPVTIDFGDQVDPSNYDNYFHNICAAYEGCGGTFFKFRGTGNVLDGIRYKTTLAAGFVNGSAIVDVRGSNNVLQNSRIEPSIATGQNCYAVYMEGPDHRYIGNHVELNLALGGTVTNNIGYRFNKCPGLYIDRLPLLSDTCRASFEGTATAGERTTATLGYVDCTALSDKPISYYILVDATSKVTINQAIVDKDPGLFDNANVTIRQVVSKVGGWTMNIPDRLTGSNYVTVDTISNWPVTYQSAVGTVTSRVGRNIFVNITTAAGTFIVTTMLLSTTGKFAKFKLTAPATTVGIEVFDQNDNQLACRTIGQTTIVPLLVPTDRLKFKFNTLSTGTYKIENLLVVGEQ